MTEWQDPLNEADLHGWVEEMNATYTPGTDGLRDEMPMREMGPGTLDKEIDRLEQEMLDLLEQLRIELIESGTDPDEAGRIIQQEKLKAFAPRALDNLDRILGEKVTSETDPDAEDDAEVEKLAIHSAHLAAQRLGFDKSDFTIEDVVGELDPKTGKKKLSAFQELEHLEPGRSERLISDITQRLAKLREEERPDLIRDDGYTFEESERLLGVAEDHDTGQTIAAKNAILATQPEETEPPKLDS